MKPKKQTIRQVDGDDEKIAAKLRARRLFQGLSQEQLGDAMGGVTFQQIQKYEAATNRMSGGRIAAAARALAVPASYFFDEIAQGDPAFSEVGFSPEAISIARAYDRVDDIVAREMMRKAIASFAKPRGGRATPMRAPRARPKTGKEPRHAAG